MEQDEEFEFDIDDFLDYLEHHGVKGMKWGQRRAQKHIDQAKARGTGDRFGNRNNAQFQRQYVDNLRRLSAGKGSNFDKLYAATFQIPIGEVIVRGGFKNASAHRLDLMQKHQRKVEAGKHHVYDVLNRLAGVDYRQLNLSHSNN